jgi:hypothetical protein
MGMTPRVLWARPRARYLLIAAVCAAAATACGTAASATGTAQSAKVSLDIKVTSISGGAEHWTLRCDPAGGTHPDPAAACRVLLRVKNPFAPVPLRCPMILAAARVARVTGTYFGQHVDTTFTQGGCQGARWAKIGQIFY